MSIPGFTAEASLAKTERRYSLVPEHSPETGKVLPQSILGPPRCGCWYVRGIKICGCI